jgi:hypothetical protein
MANVDPNPGTPKPRMWTSEHDFMTKFGLYDPYAENWMNRKNKLSFSESNKIESLGDPVILKQLSQLQIVKILMSLIFAEITLYERVWTDGIWGLGNLFFYSTTVLHNDTDIFPTSFVYNTLSGPYISGKPTIINRDAGSLRPKEQVPPKTSWLENFVRSFGDAIQALFLGVAEDEPVRYLGDYPIIRDSEARCRMRGLVRKCNIYAQSDNSISDPGFLTFLRKQIIPELNRALDVSLPGKWRSEEELEIDVSSSRKLLKIELKTSPLDPWTAGAWNGELAGGSGVKVEEPFELE